MGLVGGQIPTGLARFKKAAGKAPLSDDPGLLVNVGFVALGPGEPQYQGQARLVQNVEAGLLQVRVGKKHVHWASLMGDRTGTASSRGSCPNPAGGPPHC